MGRPAKQVDSKGAREVCDYLRGHQERSHVLDDNNYSKDYIDALKQNKFSDIMREGIGSDYLFYDEPEKTEKSVPYLQQFIDSYMSSSDKTRMWKALRKKTVRKHYAFNTFQLTLDEMSDGLFHEIKGNIMSNIGFDEKAKLSNTDIVVGLMEFASKIEDKSIKEELLLTIETSRKFRKNELYRKSDLYKTRREACLNALIKLGLDEDQSGRFFYAVRLAAFDNKAIFELLEEKKDKDVPRYLAGLHKLQEPNGDLYNLPYSDPKRAPYYNLANWVVLPSDDVNEEQLRLDV